MAASVAELERRIEQLEEQVRRLTRSLPVSVPGIGTLPPLNDAVIGYSPPLVRIDPQPRDPRLGTSHDPRLGQFSQ